MLDRLDRPLLEKEQRLLRKRLAATTERMRRGPRDAFLASLVLCAVLCCVTLVVSDAPSWIVATFWSVTALVISGLGAFSGSRSIRAVSRDLQAALASNQAHVVRVRSDAMIEFEEIEDEGADYAFQVDERTILFINGQDFYPTKRFPSTDFSIVHIHAPGGRLVEMVIEVNGKRLLPVRTIDAETKRTLTLPEHLETLAGNLVDLETILRSAHAAA